MSEWTNEEILQQAQINAKYAYLGIIAYFKHSGQSLEDWATFVGDLAASGWDNYKGASALNISRAAAFNPVAMGGSLVSLEGDEKRATAVFDFPIEQMAVSVGVSVDEFDRMLAAIYKTIFAYLGINFASKRDGERWTYELSY